MKGGYNYKISNGNDLKSFNIFNYENNDGFVSNSGYIKPNLDLIDNKKNSQINCNSNNFFKNEQNTFVDIVCLLKNNQNINSYIHIIDNLQNEDLSKMFSFNK